LCDSFVSRSVRGSWRSFTPESGRRPGYERWHPQDSDRRGPGRPDLDDRLAVYDRLRPSELRQGPVRAPHLAVLPRCGDTRRLLMPLRIRLFPEQHLVLASGHGKVTDDDMFRYQHEFWTRRDVAGFDEIVDMTQAEDFDLPTPERLRELADVSA